MSVLDVINGIFESENLPNVTCDTRLSESGLDSFGYMIFWMVLQETYGMFISLEEISMLDYESIRMQEIIQRIEDAQNNQS